MQKRFGQRVLAAAVATGIGASLAACGGGGS